MIFLRQNISCPNQMDRERVGSVGRNSIFANKLSPPPVPDSCQKDRRQSYVPCLRSRCRRNNPEIESSRTRHRRGAGINIKYFTARVGIFLWRAGGGEINVVQRDTAQTSPQIVGEMLRNINGRRGPSIITS